MILSCQQASPILGPPFRRLLDSSVWFSGSIFNSRRFPLAAFGIVWFLIGHSLESTFIPLELVHEHRNYLPLLGILLVPVVWLDNLAAKPGVTRTLALTLVAVALVYPAFVTAMRAICMPMRLIRTQVEAQFHPDSARTNYEAGRSLAALADSGSRQHDRQYLVEKAFRDVHGAGSRLQDGLCWAK